MTYDDLHDMTDRDLHRLAWEISEVLVERATIRFRAEIESELAQQGHSVRWSLLETRERATT